MKGERTLAWLATGLILSGVSFVPVVPRLIWNRTESVPAGLYLVSPTSAPSRGDLVAYQPEPARAAWLEAQGYTGRGWPLIKPVAGLEGDEVCRTGNRIMINGVWVAEALAADSGGRALPAWHGCKSLGPGDLFLIADDPRSVDGRYFGVEDTGRLLGRVTRAWPPAPPIPAQDADAAVPVRTHDAASLSDDR